MLGLIRLPSGFRLTGGLCLGLATLLMVSACSPQTAKPGSPEALLNAEGEWKLVEEEASPTPEQKHMQTRRQVNPQKSSASYTQTANSPHVDEDIHFRVLRLERQMKTLRGDFDKILPPLAEDKKSGKALKAAIAEIQNEKNEDEFSFAPDVPLVEMPVVAAAPKSQMRSDIPPPPMVITPEEPQKAPKVTELPAPVKPQSMAEKTPAPAHGAVAVQAFRTGEHPGKTRLVLDVSAASKFSADLDSREKLLVVELPGVQWNTAPEKTFPAHPLLKRYTVQPSGDGSRLVVELRKAAKLVMKSAIDPDKTSGHRIVLDISAL
ncbi:MAG: AMIN domain-containing protein [Alphaproteobacteria bacterium]|nr:AMIN domain-containing protein [Alphaproteobacteria bacterium]